MYWRGCVKISCRVPWFSCLLKDLCCECFAQKSNIPKSLFVGKTQKMQRIFLYKNLPWKCKFHITQPRQYMCWRTLKSTQNQFQKNISTRSELESFATILLLSSFGKEFEKMKHLVRNFTKGLIWRQIWQNDESDTVFDKRKNLVTNLTKEWIC